jgi:hypothetical protein
MGKMSEADKRQTKNDQDNLGPEIPKAQPQEHHEAFLRKNGVALAALVVAIFAMTTGVYNSCETRRANRKNEQQWRLLNQPHLDITDVDFFPFLIVKEPPEGFRFAPNYEPLITFETITNKERDFKQLYAIYTELLIWDLKSNQAVNGAMSCQSSKDIDTQVKRLGLKDWGVRKHYRARFRLRNTGSLAANNTIAKVRTIVDDKEFQHIIGPKDYEGGNKIFTMFVDIITDPSLKPSTILFRISFDYDFEGQRLTSQQKTYTYRFDQNRWEP